MQRIKTLLLLLMTLPMCLRAQYYSVNIDKETIATMAAVYGAEYAAETYYNEQVKEILKHYNAAEVATAGIFASKFLERKAWTTLGIWSSDTENYYYRRIYSTVKDRIMPKIYRVSGMMLKDPSTALYWVPYMMKVCDDTKNLCYQFESVCTNSTLSFSSIQFLEISQEIRNILTLSNIGNVNFRALLDDFSKVPGNFSKEKLGEDIDKLYNIGVGLATAGASNALSVLTQNNSLKSVFSGKISALPSMLQGYGSLFSSLERNAGQTLLNIVGGQDGVMNLFNLSDYNITGWMTDFNNESEGRYYTQRWYIYRRESGRETLASYSPPEDKDAVIYGPHWYRIPTNDKNYYPTSSQFEAAKSNSESMAGWTRGRVQQLNNSNDGYYYYIDLWQRSYIISRNNQQTHLAYAYIINVGRSWNWTFEAYEDVFDSYSMDLDVFKKQMKVRLEELNRNEEGYVYYLTSDSRRYYQATDAAKLKGVETVTINVTCSDGVTLSQGTTSYKCRGCGANLDQHSRDCSMMTSVKENELDLSGLQKQYNDCTAQVTRLQSLITTLTNENKTLSRKIATSSITEASRYRQQIAKNNKLIDDYEKQLSKAKSDAQEAKEALEEAQQDNSVSTDDYYRIPHIMADCKSAYSLTWQGEGTWDGFTYKRTATMPNINGVITFEATLSVARRPKRRFGILVHRAILQIDWKLTTDYSNTSTVDVMNLDPQASDQEKNKQVNDRISEIARVYPNCQITTQYAKSEATEDGTDDGVKHLLWSSDRLEVAREVDSRLNGIYADLVTLEKFLYYKHTWVDWMKQVAPTINVDAGRKRTVIDSCYVRWRDNGRLEQE